MDIKEYCLVLLLLSWAPWAAAQTVSEQPLPVIDVHLHATNEDSNTVGAVLHQMNTYNVVLAVLSGADRELAARWKQAAPDRFLIGPSFPCTDGMYPRMYPCFEENDGWPDLDWLQSQYENGRMQAMGEMLYVYYGIPPGDDRLDPYFELAEQYDIPVGVHAGHGPPPRGRLPGCCPNFDEAMGNPLLLEPVLERHLDLRIWLMHGGEINFHEQAVELMKAYPNVYADLSILNSMRPSGLYARLLHDFIEEGLEDRIMLGSDNLPIGPIIERLESFEFLSGKQRRKILYDNAAAFFGLSDKTIENHYGR